MAIEHYKKMIKMKEKSKQRDDLVQKLIKLRLRLQQEKVRGELVAENNFYVAKFKYIIILILSLPRKVLLLRIQNIVKSLVMNSARQKDHLARSISAINVVKISGFGTQCLPVMVSAAMSVQATSILFVFMKIFY